MSGNYVELVGFLKTRVPEFTQSPEYLLHKGEMDDLPGVILAAFGNYLSLKTNADEMVTTPLDVLGEAAEWEDAMVDASLRDEFFEAIGNDPRAERILASLMTGRLRDLYDRWKAAQ